VDEPQPAIPTSQSTGHPPDLHQRLVQALMEVRRVTFRARTTLRTSSALVRWVLLVLVVGGGAALLIAFAVTLLVSLLPGTGG
jgi:CHASE3 domain sensor protein